MFYYDDPANVTYGGFESACSVDYQSYGAEEEEAEHINRITSDLFVGDIFAAGSSTILRKWHITHIVTAAKFVEPSFPEEFEYHVIEIYDTEEEDIQKHFLQAIIFIEIAIRMGGRVLVHCMAGMSRSVSVCVAYLMTKQRISMEAALEQVKRVRPIASPNLGFCHQLRVFQEKAHKFDLDAHVLDAIIDKPEPEPEPSFWYRCRKCRHKLVNDNHIIPHQIPQKQKEFYRKRTHGVKDNRAVPACSMWFVQEGEWMGDLDEMEGKIECTRCKTKVGAWAWAGGQCSCGEWVTPFFQILKSRVDEVPVVKLPPVIPLPPPPEHTEETPTSAPAPAPQPMETTPLEVSSPLTSC